MKKTYIIVMGDTNYHLVGPFDDDFQAVSWVINTGALAKCQNIWRVIDLTYDPTEGLPQVFDPSVATKEHI